MAAAHDISDRRSGPMPLRVHVQALAPLARAGAAPGLSGTAPATAVQVRVECPACQRQRIAAARERGLLRGCAQVVHLLDRADWSGCDGETVFAARRNAAVLGWHVAGRRPRSLQGLRAMAWLALHLVEEDDRETGHLDGLAGTLAIAVLDGLLDMQATSRCRVIMPSRG